VRRAPNLSPLRFLLRGASEALGCDGCTRVRLVLLASPCRRSALCGAAHSTCGLYSEEDEGVVAAVLRAWDDGGQGGGCFVAVVHRAAVLWAPPGHSPGSAPRMHAAVCVPATHHT